MLVLFVLGLFVLPSAAILLLASRARPERARSEKWCRVHAIVPVAYNLKSEGTVRHEFAAKGPVAMPMAK